ncbi:hypothetical protein [Tenacibaculum sediminilitoris]|uniref:hypothetical protein n=1 Tax=Tenacibaculum sediminilitoris TaxID=1820334 RepID=UPI0038B60A68
MSEKYDIVLKKHENHLPLDLNSFKITKAKYFGLKWYNVLWIKLKKYFLIKFKYHLMIYDPVVLFVTFQLYKAFYN